MFRFVTAIPAYLAFAFGLASRCTESLWFAGPRLFADLCDGYRLRIHGNGAFYR